MTPQTVRRNVRDALAIAAAVLTSVLVFMLVGCSATDYAKANRALVQADAIVATYQTALPEDDEARPVIDELRDPYLATAIATTEAAADAGDAAAAHVAVNALLQFATDQVQRIDDPERRRIAIHLLTSLRVGLFVAGMLDTQSEGNNLAPD